MVEFGLQGVGPGVSFHVCKEKCVTDAVCDGGRDDLKGLGGGDESVSFEKQSL